MSELTVGQILDLPLEGVHLVEASAGSGKTWTLAGLHLRALADGHNVDQVLVVTFTNAATDELRGRIRERLRECLGALEGGGTGDPLLSALAARHAGDDALARRLRDAIGAMDEAAVHTIHGFCQRVLTEHAFATGAPFDPHYLEDETEHRQRVARALWRESVATLPPPALHALRTRWAGPDALLADLDPPFTRELEVRLADPRDHEALAAELARLHAAVAALWAGERAAIERAAQDIERDGLLVKRAPFDEPGWSARALDALAAFVEHAGPYPEALRAGLLRERARKRPAGMAQRLEAAMHPLFALGDGIAEVGELLLPAFERWVRLALRERYARYRAERGLVTHDDVLARVRDALQGAGGEALARRLARRWPVALVDEFQDTDPVQYAILRALAAAGQAQVLVGDPKQAIYAFRGADIFAYLQARRDTPPARRHVLRTNWRSTPPLVAAVNRLFARAGGFVFDEIPFTPAVAAPRDAPLRAALPGVGAALELWRIPDCEGRDGTAKAWSREEATGLIARSVASHVAGLLEAARRGDATIEQRPLAARDIAVLTRSHVQAQAVRAALAEHGVGAAYAGREGVFQSDEAAELEPLIAAVAGPDDPRAVRRALASPLIGWSPGRLAAELEEPARWDAWLERFAQWQRCWREHGFLPMFHRLLAGLRLSERLMASGRGERALTNLLHLAELTQRAAREHHGLEELVAWYRRERRAGRSADEQLLRLESDESLVRIQTLHGAKGLQFPVVYVPFAWDARDWSRPRSQVPLHHDDDGRLLLDYAAADALARARREQLAEDVRLLYVALTRAVYHTFVPCGWVGKAYGDSALAWLLHGGGRPDDLDAVLDAVAAGAEPGAIAVRPLPEPGRHRLAPDRMAAADLAARPFTASVPREWRVTSYSGLVRGQHTPVDRDAEPAGGPDVAPPAHADVFALPRGVRLGNFMHALLEQLDLARADEAVAELAERLLPRFGLDPGLEPVVTAWVKRVLATPLPPGVRLGELGVDARAAELEFWYRLDPFRAEAFNATLARHGWAGLDHLPAGRIEGLLNGQVDLVFTHAGRWYVADYKTNWLGDRIEDYTGEALDAAMQAHRYDLQYLVYLLALDRFLARRLAGYDPQRHLGGALYLFLRGMDGSGRSGVWSAAAPLALLAELRGLLQHGDAHAA